MKELFKRLGLSEKETQTFLKLLELGAQPVSVIAKHVGIPRTTMYLLLDGLKNTQLIEEFERAGIMHVKCIPVKNIIDILHAKESSIHQTINLFEEKLPEIAKLENKLSVTPSIKFFEGKDAVMKMYESALGEKQICTIFNPDLVNRLMPEYYFKFPEIIAKNGINAKELLMSCKIAYKYKKNFSSKNHKIRILPKNVRLESDTIICLNKIYMISYGNKDLSAVEIWNKSLAETQQALFNELWSNN